MSRKASRRQRRPQKRGGRNASPPPRRKPGLRAFAGEWNATIGQSPWFAPALTAVFAALLFYGALHHEMWRDELQAWLIARDSIGLLDLFHHVQYEGTPPLWHLLLMPLARITHNPFAMQMLNLCIAAATVFLVAKYAPFTLLQKVLFALGFFPLYQYGLIPRSYGIGLLLVAVVCVLLPRRYQNPLPLAGALFLLAHSSVHACILVIGVMVALAVDYYMKPRALNWRRAGTGISIAAAGIVSAVLFMIPPADIGYEEAAGWTTKLDSAKIMRVLALFQTVLFPTAEGSPHFWGFPIVQSMPYFGALLVGVMAACYWRRPAALAMFLVCTFGLLAFFYMKYSGTIRHHGFLLIALLLLLWGGKSMFALPCKRISVFTKNASTVGAYALTALLLVQAVSGIRAVMADVQRPFSYGKAAAQYIQANGLEELPIIGHEDFAVTAVVGYLPPRTVHYLQGDREGSFVFWNRARTQNIAPLQSKMQAVAAQSGKDVLLILNRPLTITPEMQSTVRPLAAFDGPAVHRSEWFWLYRYSLPR